MDEREDIRAMAIAASVSEPTIMQSAKTEADVLFKSNNFSTAPLSKTNKGNENIIDSKNLPRKIKDLMKMIVKPETTPEAKIKIAEFMGNKLFDIYRMTDNNREIIIKELVGAILNAETMSTPLRLFYLKFRDESISYPVSIRLFNSEVRNKMAVVPYFQILKFILHSSINLRKEEHCTSVLDEFENLFNDDQVSIFTKMEIADIFFLNNRNERAHQMLRVIREIEFNLNQHEDTYQMFEEKLLTVYDDSQNVHNLNVNKSVLSACVRLMEIEQPNSFDPDKVKVILKLCSPNFSRTIDTVMERIEIDTSKFNSESNIFGLYDVFSSLWAWINKHPEKDNLYIRLVEEMSGMVKHCTTGHLSRFINTIQGYTDDEKLQVYISEQEQINAVLGHYLDLKCKNAPENVTESMSSESKQPFYDFIKEVTNDKILDILKEYGDVHLHIIEVLKIYSNWKYWSIVDNIISCDPKPSILLEVGDLCMEGCPCKHTCVLDTNTFIWNGKEIFNWFLQNNIEVPIHFSKYEHEITYDD